MGEDDEGKAGSAKKGYVGDAAIDTVVEAGKLSTSLVSKGKADTSDRGVMVVDGKSTPNDLVISYCCSLYY